MRGKEETHIFVFVAFLPKALLSDNAPGQPVIVHGGQSESDHCQGL